MLVEWLKEGWLLASAEMQHSELRGGTLLLALLHSPLRYVPSAAARLLIGINRDRLQQDFAGVDARVGGSQSYRMLAGGPSVLKTIPATACRLAATPKHDRRRP